MTSTLSMSALYKKLGKIQLQKDFVRKMGLPSWWDDELNDKPIAVLEGAGHIAKRLNLDLKSLLDHDQSARFKPIPEPKFKYHNQKKQAIPTIAQQIASRVAEVVGLATELEFKSIPSDSYQIRSEIVSQHHRVTLDSLLDYCWQKGIAVVHFNKYPPQTRKITGMIQWVGDRPVIILSNGSKIPACLAFDLAHELGHLALGHVKEGMLIDDQINQKSDDQEEIESNKFAVNLLVHRFDNYFKNKKFDSANHLNDEIIKALQIDPTIDPSALAFNYGWYNSKDWGFVNKYVKKINASNNGHNIINGFLEKHINWDDLSDDNVDYLERILGD
jgi:Zn-dependent peptidase ImmA (M78 family)